MEVINYRENLKQFETSLNLAEIPVIIKVK